MQNQLLRPIGCLGRICEHFGRDVPTYQSLGFLVLRRLCLYEGTGLVLLEGTLIEFDHATLMVNSLVMTVHCSRQLIALRVIGNDRRRTAFHIVMMILITSHIPIQGISTLTRVTVTCHMPLYKV